MNYKNTSSYLFGAIDPEFRSTGIGTELLINSIEQSYNSSKDTSIWLVLIHLQEEILKLV